MAQVFRIFHQALNEAETGWFASSPIGDGIVKSISIQETDGKKQPTSIPSPFAQIDLVRAAFNTVNNEYNQHRTDLNDKKDAHRLVSNALDIGEILFNYSKHQNKLSLSVWHKDSDLEQLIHSKSKEHKHLGRTLKLFLSSADNEQFNFDRLSKFFILKYRGTVIGGTSPKTLFFAAPDALSVGVDIFCGNDRMLDQEPLALYKRDRSFIKFLFYLRQENGSFAEDFPEVHQYLNHTLEVLNAKDHEFARRLEGYLTEDSLIPLILPENPGVHLEILPGYKLMEKQGIELENSDFFIQTTKEVVPKPLVLPVESDNTPRIYTTEPWNPQTKAPLKDNRLLRDRTLPKVNDKYPYLTLGDFLLDEIIELPYELDQNHFFVSREAPKFLLPINKSIFKYFNADQLAAMILMKPLAGDAVEVILKVPVKKGKITYKKTFYRTQGAIKDESRGKIIETAFTLGVYPFVKSDFANYSISTAYKSGEMEIKSVQLVNSEDNTSKTTERRKRSVASMISEHFLTQDAFDAIVINAGGFSNLVIPRLAQHISTTETYRFAIDFGTTNTHIEYLHTNTRIPKSYTIEKDHFVFLRDENAELRGRSLVNVQDQEALLKQELLDNSLGENQYKFPFRSVLLENKTINYDNPNYLYGDVNIGFDYEKSQIRPHLTKKSNLKWMHLDENDNNARVEKFIRQLLELCKNLVLEKNGDLSSTEIIWLYPTSMTYNHRQRFHKIWEDQFSNVFPEVNATNIKGIPESIAPFYYFQTIEDVHNQTSPVVSIDIGGGTSDITIFQGNIPRIITSVKFAGNSIFGDGFNSNIQRNGFVRKFYPIFMAKLKANESYTKDEQDILDDIFSKYQSSDDLSNFLFSLEENHNLKSRNIDLSYSKALSEEDDLKIPFILFYAALGYHIAQIMKLNGLSLPRHFLFSGTASKTMDILDSSRDKRMISKLFNELFSFFYTDQSPRIEVRTYESPKVLTAKGALQMTNENDEIQDFIYNSIGTENDERLPKNLKYSDIKEEIITGVVKNIQQFYELLDSIDSKMSFHNSFGVSSHSMDVFVSCREEDIKEFLLTAIEERKKDVRDKSAAIDETMFFYPFIGVLNRLASKIVG